MALEVRFLNEMLFAYIKSGLLRAALDLELFTHINHGRRTAAEIATAAGAHARAVGIILDALTAQELLHKDGDRYSLDPLVEALLVKDSPTYAGAFTRHVESLVWNAVGKLAEIAGTGSAGSDGRRAWAPVLGRVQRSSEGIAGSPPMPLSTCSRSTRTARRILDVAVGRACTASARCSAIRAADLARLAERPRARAQDADGATSPIASPGSRQRVRRAAAAGARPTPSSSATSSTTSPEENVKLAKRLAAALKPGGQVVVHEFVPDDAHATSKR
jgi:hypothetical protein